MHTRGRMGQQFLELLYVIQGIDWSENEDVWSELPTRWNTLVPIKVNILGWRIRMDRLPTREKLDQTGIDLSSLLCPVSPT
ncbi:hypothetical protein Tco_0723037 [Tanacetum coccineum]